jgi:hypothetical protein
MMLFRRRAAVDSPNLNPRRALDELMTFERQIEARRAELLNACALAERSAAALRQLLGHPVSAPKEADAEASASTSYVAGSWFLYDCHTYLTQRQPEWLHYVTGVRVQGVRTLDRIVGFALAEQSMTYVRGDEEASRDALCDIAERGHFLHGAFHSHRAKGPGSISPSQTDIRHQERLERGRYPVVSAIFSEDGYIRFFTLHRPFAVAIFGTGVEQIDDALFKLTAIR